MIEVYQNLWVGSQDDEVKVRGNPEWYIVSACKEPYHRKAVGYTTRALPKDHPEYLIAERPGHLVLNLVDADDPAYIRDEIIDKAIERIDEQLIEHRKVLVHCNQGQSRGPTIAMLYLAAFTDVFNGLDHAESVIKFTTMYPPYAPARGMALYAERDWPVHRHRNSEVA